MEMEIKTWKQNRENLLE